MKDQDLMTQNEISGTRPARPAICAVAAAAIGLTTSLAIAGQTAYVGNYNGAAISVVDLDERVNTGTISTPAAPRGMTLSNDRSTLYAVVAGGAVLAIDTATNVATVLAPSEVPSAFGIAITADDSRLYVANGTTWTVSVIDAKTGDLMTSIPVVANPVFTAMSPTESRLFVTTSNYPSGDTMISVIDTTTDTVDDIINTPYSPSEIAVTPDGSLLFVSHEFDAAVSVVDTATSSVLTTIPVTDGPRGITITADGQTAYVANAYAGNVTAIDVATLAVSGEVNAGGSPFMVGVSHDGRTYVTQFGANALAEIDFTSQKVVGSIPVGPDPYNIVVLPLDAATCAEDVTGDGSVGFADLLALLGSWGPCDDCTPGSCVADIDGNCAVDLSDLLALLIAWGSCP